MLVAGRATESSAPPAAPIAEIGVSRGMVVNLGVFSSVANASRAQAELMPRLPQELRASSKVVQARVNGRELYRVVIDGLPNRYRANLLCGRLKAEGLDCYTPL